MPEQGRGHHGFLLALALCAAAATLSASKAGASADREGGRALLQTSTEFCECADGAKLACPDALAANFEASMDIKEEGDRASWALECSGLGNYSDGVAGQTCSKACKAEVEKVYGKAGYCTCVSAKAREQISKQSFTLLAMSPNDILNACFKDKCTFELPDP